MKYQTLTESVKEYLDFRRSLGYALHIEGQELIRFARYADTIGHKGAVTIELALQWAKLPQNCSPIYHARRLDTVRRFARYMKLSVAETEIPPEGILGPSYRRRPSPHIYSEKEISDILQAAKDLTPVNGLRPHTYATLLGLLACTGMRISEALRLAQNDVNICNSIITVVETKFHKSRIIPLHPTTVDALKSYVEIRNKKHHTVKTNAFFITEKGTSLKYYKVYMTFRDILFKLGWRNKIGDRGPRIHDLRHTFAVCRLLQWYRNGVDVHQKINSLSTYLGHVKVADTYWYLTATAELMSIAASRFENITEKGGVL